MEIRNQSIQYFEAIPRINKNLRVVTARMDNSRFISCALYGAAARGPYADHSAPTLFGLIYDISCFFGNLIVLGMHMMIQYIIFLDRTECTESYVKCHIGKTDTHLFDLL